MPPRNPHDLPVHNADHTRPRAASASSSTRASTQRRPINSRPIDTRRAGNGNPDGEPTYVRRTPPTTPKTSTSTAPKTLPNRQKHNPRPKPRSRVAATAHKKRTRRRPILAYCTCGPARASSVLRLVSLRVRRLQVQPLPPRCIAWSILLKD